MPVTPHPLDTRRRRSWLPWRRRPLSFFLLPAILVVVLLGVQFVHYREAPARFAFFLGLNIVFFFGVIFIALVECLEVLRNALAEERRIYRQTLGDRTFAEDLGRHVDEGRGARRAGS